MTRKTLRYTHPSFAILVGLVFTLVFAASSTAREQVILQKSGTNPQTGAAQNYIDQANKTTVHANALEVESSLNANQRALILFDFSLLPNVGIKTAELTLTFQTAPTSNRNYQVFSLDSFFTQSSATWNTRAADLAWTTKNGGGDIPGTATDTEQVRTRNANVAFNITTDVQAWYSGNASGVPQPNYGTLIKDSNENSVLPVRTVFDTNSSASPPSLTVTFVQNVKNLTATAGNNQVALSWAYPAALGTVLEANTGVLILRRADFPVDKGSVPADGNNFNLCDTIGTGTVVFKTTTLATTFTDDNTDTCGAPANGTMYFYKVFVMDSARNYSDSGPSANGGSLTTEEISAMPSASAPYSSNWMLATYSTTLAPPSLFPGLVATVGTQTNFLFTVNANTGLRQYPPISLGGAVSGRTPIIDAPDSSLGEDMAYVADQSGLAYGIAIDTGQILWTVDPLQQGGTPFLGGGALVVKSFATSAFTQPDDLLILGTRNSATTSGNAVVAVDGNTGATVWNTVGKTGTIPPMDIIDATPTISYTQNAIWVTSESNGGTAQPSLWKLDANTGKVLATLALGDIDSSPVLTPDEAILFVGTNAGTLYAIDTSSATVITSTAGGDGSIIDYPAVINFSSPYSLVFSGTADVHGLTYDAAAKTFTAVWKTPVTTPSAPIGVFGLTDIFVGSGDGTIHELNVNTGVDVRDVVANTGQPGIVGDPSLDVSLMRIYASTNDQRMYSFPFPF